ncbi:MAG: phytase [Bacteroidia bacterium]|nr:phytase [Bacteroidia bacterium]
MTATKKLILLGTVCLLTHCSPDLREQTTADKITPVVVTEPVQYDTDDPAIWVNPDDPRSSLILGTDKEEDGALYVFDLDGKVVHDKVVHNLARPNNVDVEYGLNLGGQPTDIAVVTERFTNSLRIFRLPDMMPVDGGGIPVFEGETGPEFRDLMGIALYKKPTNGEIFAIVGRKNGPSGGGYLWQYRLEDDGTGQVKTTLVRKFGAYSGKKEIEAIAVDDALGYVYYSDEQVGVRKYSADPDSADHERALFATTGFAEDHEGISFYNFPDGTGYILVSDQGANKFHIYPREGSPGNPHDHPEIRVINVSTMESDGSETLALPLGTMFPKGIFIAMSTDKTFHYYRWEDVAGDQLKLLK